MKRIVCAVLAVLVCFSGCASSNRTDSNMELATSQMERNSVSSVESEDSAVNYEKPAQEIKELESGLSSVRFEGDDGFEAFLTGGGAVSDREVIGFLAENMLSELGVLTGLTGAFGCSAFLTNREGGGYYFGRNFDWNRCETLIVESYPETGYASISTVNTDFIQQGAGLLSSALKSNGVLTLAALYAPLDGMNEKGLAVSVNMIQDNSTIEQNTEKPDITTTTAVRLLLNKAADVEEALELLESYDLHASFGYMVHFAIADAAGNSVCAEYVGNELSVVETPIVTNFYLTEGEKYGIGTSQSHERYEILKALMGEKEAMSADDAANALSAVSKGNFGEFESTEWSIVFDLEQKTACYYHREDYDTAYKFSLSEWKGARE